MLYADPCKCLGRPLRFTRGECFTCGRFLPGVAGRYEPASERPGYMALLEAVDRKRVELGPRRTPAPRHNHRRVVIDGPREPGAALRKVQALAPAF